MLQQKYLISVWMHFLLAERQLPPFVFLNFQSLRRHFQFAIERLLVALVFQEVLRQSEEVDLTFC